MLNAHNAFVAKKIEKAMDECYYLCILDFRGGVFMGMQFEEYLKSIENENTRKLLQSSYRVIGDYEDSGKTLDDVKRIFYAAKVKTPQSARNFCTQFRSFARHIQDEGLLMMLDSFGTNEFLEISLKVMELGAAKYFSHEKFKTAYHSINNSYVLNPFYTQTLFLCIYEGVYSRDFSVLINLRAADIHGNSITCRNGDGSSYRIDVSDKLAADLINLSTTHNWISRNRHGYCEKGLFGEYHDSCFKVEKREKKNRRNPLKETYKTSYRNRIREIVSTEIGYDITAFDVYVSGIMHRISQKLHSQGISVCDAFSKNNRDMTTRRIIGDELQRSNYRGSISQFKQLVEGQEKLFETSSVTRTNTVGIFAFPNKKRMIDEAIQDVLSYADIEADGNDAFQLVATGITVSKKELLSLGDRLIYPRSGSAARTALACANHLCEIDEDHPTFISKRYELPYTEPHHLVPIAFSDNFEVSLDVPENVVSLCSNCHNEIHYGRDVSNILRWLYENRKAQLESVGIKVSFEDLLLMYNVRK